MPAALVPTSALLPIMEPFADGCPAPVLERLARLATIDLCERTRCWRHVVTVHPCDPAGALAVPVEAAIFEFERATLNGRPLTPIAFTAFDGDRVAGTPEYVTQSAPGVVTVLPWPADASGLVLELSMFLKPRADVLIGLDPTDPMRDVFNVVPDFMVTSYGERIADGALARARMMRGEPWFEPSIAAVHQARFEAAAARGAASTIRGQQRAPVRTTPSYM